MATRSARRRNMQYKRTRSPAPGKRRSRQQTPSGCRLGVFAIVEGDQTSSDDVFQLAVDRQGVIRGNYHNVATDQMESIAGAVDKTTQRAAWTIGSDKTPVYEAGIANLTMEQTPMLVHTGDGQPRQVNLIRLPEPAK